MSAKKERFYKAYGEIHDLLEAQQLIEWDQQVVMPKGGAEQRANSVSTLSKMIHERITSGELGDIIEDFEAVAETDWDRAHLREARKSYEKQKKIPADLVAEKSMAAALSQGVWEKTRPSSDFKQFLPYLDRVLRVTREIARTGDPDRPYDFLLDEFEPSMKTAELDPLFGGLKPTLKESAEKYMCRNMEACRKPVSMFVPRQAQEKIGLFFLKEMDFDLERGRMDISAHPFTSGTMDDVRITTRYNENFLPTSLFGVLHEGGHALYEQGLDREHYRFPAGQACSLGIHESQSRFWENIVGRSRAFWNRYFPAVNEMAGGAFSGVKVEDFFAGINCVYPTFIRVEADEVNYNLHIILRYELEKEMINGSLEAKDLPEAWNARFGELFGRTPETHSSGVMQDVHWSVGLVGYFPTYALGNLYGAQIRETAEKELGRLDDLVARGELRELRRYLVDRIHSKGRLLPPKELIEKACGGPMSEKPFLNYIVKKYGSLC